MRTISFSEARNQLKKLIDQVVGDADVAVITRRDAPDAVVMSLDTFNSWQETVHLLKVPARVRFLSSPRITFVSLGAALLAFAFSLAGV